MYVHLASVPFEGPELPCDQMAGVPGTSRPVHMLCWCELTIHGVCHGWRTASSSTFPDAMIEIFLSTYLFTEILSTSTLMLLSPASINNFIPVMDQLYSNLQSLLWPILYLTHSPCIHDAYLYSLKLQLFPAGYHSSIACFSTWILVKG